jgi:hypothetical protein
MIRTELVRVVKQGMFCVMRKLNESCNLVTEDILFCCSLLTVVQRTKLFFIMNTNVYFYIVIFFSPDVDPLGLKQVAITQINIVFI